MSDKVRSLRLFALQVAGCWFYSAGAAATWAWAFGADADCTGGLPSPRRMFAFAMAGTGDRIRTANLSCALGVGSDREVLLRMLVGVCLTASALIAWTALGSTVFQRRVSRDVGRRMVFASAVGGALAIAETAGLWYIVGDPVRRGNHVADLVGAGLATSMTLGIFALVYAMAAMATSSAILVRGLLGPSFRPQFDAVTSWAPQPDKDRVGPPIAPEAGDVDGVVAGVLTDRFRSPLGAVWPTHHDDGEPVVGVSLSGGGIRAAAFGAGALSRLVDAGAMSRVDYLSTVSGGGYTGMAYQIATNAVEGTTSPVGPQPFASQSPERSWIGRNARFLWPPIDQGAWRSTLVFAAAVFTLLRGILFNLVLVAALAFVVVRPVSWLLSTWPFIAAPGSGTRPVRPERWWQLIAAGLITAALSYVLWPILHKWWKKDSQSVATLRVLAAASIAAIAAMASLVAFVDGGGPWISLLVVGGLGYSAVRGKLSNWRSSGVGFGLAVAATGMAKWMIEEVFDKSASRTITLDAFEILLRIVLVLAALVVVAALVRIPLSASSRQQLSRHSLVCLGLAAVVMGFAGRTLANVAWLGGIALLLGVALIGWGASKLSQLPDSSEFFGPSVSAARFFAGLPLIVSTGVLVAALLGTSDVPRLATEPRELTVWVVVAVLVGLTYLFIDQKRWSPHPFYKRRLAAAFSPVRTEAASDDGTIGLRVVALPFRVRTTLHTSGRPARGQPTLLICAAAYDTDRLRPAEIQAVPYVFSWDFVGSADLGFARSLDLDAVLGGSNDGDGTLHAAAAISGAAVSSALGAVRMASLTQLITLFNLRLGVWLPNPSYVNRLRADDQADKGERWVRTRRLPYLVKELIGRYDIEDRFVYVTDGGQLDNLGLYELLVRRCRVIYAFDASGDSNMKVTTILQLMDLAHKRLGVEFMVRNTVVAPTAWASTFFSSMTEPEPDPPSHWRFAADKISKTALAVVGVLYPDAGTGLAVGEIVFAKARLAPSTNGSYPAVLHYAQSDNRFPSNSTADQFMDPEQFDAYLVLGSFVANEVLNALPLASPSAITG